MSQFTNRHGKKINVKDDEIKPVIIEDTAPTQTQANKRPQRSLPKVRISKKATFIFLLVIVGVLLAGLVTADGIKRDYERQTATMKRTIVERSEQSSSAETTPESAITSLRQSLNATSDCKVSGVDVVSWYGPAKDAREECQTIADSYKKLQLSLDDMITLSRYADQMTKALKPALVIPSGGQFAVIGEYAASWDVALTSLKDVAPPDMLRAHHAELITKTSAVKDAWGALQTANSMQNRDEFTEAEKQLNDQYTEFRSAANAMNTVVLSTQASITRYIDMLSS